MSKIFDASDRQLPPAPGPVTQQLLELSDENERLKTQTKEMGWVLLVLLVFNVLQFLFGSAAGWVAWVVQWNGPY